MLADIDREATDQTRSVFDQLQGRHGPSSHNTFVTAAYKCLALRYLPFISIVKQFVSTLLEDNFTDMAA